MAGPTRIYTKLPLDVPAQLQHLKAKGLIVRNVPAALNTLRRVGYNRLLIYTRPLQNATKTFLPGTAFSDVVALYEFDRKLRLLCMEGIERLEVALRSAIANTLCVPSGAHFYSDLAHYESLALMVEFVSYSVKAKSLAISHYRATYLEPAHPPLWSVLEAVTYGTLSRLFSNLTVGNRHLVAAEFTLDERVLVSWFRSINELRNMCAHHNRIWNSKVPVNTPLKANHVASDWPTLPHGNQYFAARAVVMADLLKRVDRKARWHIRLRKLIDANSHIKSADMGFNAAWQGTGFWSDP